MKFIKRIIKLFDRTYIHSIGHTSIDYSQYYDEQFLIRSIREHRGQE